MWLLSSRPQNREIIPDYPRARCNQAAFEVGWALGLPGRWHRVTGGARPPLRLKVEGSPASGSGPLATGRDMAWAFPQRPGMGSTGF